MDELGGGWRDKRTRVKPGRRLCGLRGPVGEPCDYSQDHSGRCSWGVARRRGGGPLGVGVHVRHVEPTPHTNHGVIQAVAPPPAGARLVRWTCGCRSWHPLDSLEVDRDPDNDMARLAPATDAGDAA